MKCARYWPDETNPELICDNEIKVNFIRQTNTCDDYLLREFTVSNTKFEQDELSEPLIVYQFQYLAWTDHGVPNNVHNTIDFIEHVNKIFKDINTNKPVTVHCRFELKSD